MNRKGFFISPVFVIKVLFVLLVGLLAISKGMAFAKKDTIFKQTSIDDISMMVNTLAALPGDAVVTYPRNLSEYSLVLDSTSVILFKPGEPEQEWLRRSFFLPEGYTGEGVAEKESAVCLEKKKKRVILRGCAENES